MQSLGYEDVLERSGTPGNPASGFLRMFADSTGRIKYVDAAGNVTDIIPAIQQEKYVYAADAGSANAYAVTLSPAPSVQAGSEAVFVAAHANTGASTLSVNGASAALTKNGTTALSGGEIVAGQIITAKYDGANWQIVAPGSGTGSGTVTHTTGALTADMPVFGNGSGDIKVGTKTGNTDNVVTSTTTAKASGNLGSWDANGNLIDSGLALSAVTSGGNTTVSVTSTTGSGSGNFVQSATAGSTTTTISATLPANVTAGNTLLVFLFAGMSTTSISSVTDDKGNAYSLLASIYPTSSQYCQQWAYIALNAVAGATTVTANYSQRNNQMNMIVAEYSGIISSSALDAESTLDDSAGTYPATVGPINTTGSNDLLVSTFAIYEGGTVSMNASGFTARVHKVGVSDTNLDCFLSDASAPSAGPYSATWSGTVNGSAIGAGFGAGILIALKTSASVTTTLGTVTGVSASSPLVSSGGATPTISFASQSPNTVFAGPSSGNTAASPTFRALVSADLPVATASAAGAVKPDGSTITITNGVISAASSAGSSSFAGPNSTWLFDDFLSNVVAGVLGWVSNGGGGGLFFQNSAPDATNRPGNWNIQANSGSWEYMVLGPFNAAKSCYLSSAVGSTIVSSCYAKAGGQSRFGWFNNTGQVTTDGVYFCYDATANGNSNWWAYVVSGGTVTKTDTGIAAAAWCKLEIDTAGTSATFKINGSQVATGSVPSGELMTPGYMAYGTNSQQANIFTDWFAMQLNYSR